MNIIKSFFLPFIAFLAIFSTACEFNNHSIKVIQPQKGLYIVDIDASNPNIQISPYISQGLETVDSVAIKTNSIVAINAGFFDPSNQKTTSYVVKDSVIAANPYDNEHLITNESLKPYLANILNRSEFRILSDANGKISFDIARHNSKPSFGMTLIHSIQAGPELYPCLAQEEEGFVVRQNGKTIRDSVGALQQHARSAVAFKGNHLYLIALSNENKATLQDLTNFLKPFSFDKIMAFDGGSSTSLYVKLKGKVLVDITSAKDNSARRVKSILLVSNK